MVQLDWLLDSIQAKKRPKETTYLFTALKDSSAPIADSGNANTSQNNSPSNQLGTSCVSRSNSQKASALIDGSGGVNLSRKKGQSNQVGTKRGLGVDSGDEVLKAISTTEPPKKKQKDVQKASSITLRVPVDEAFPSPRKLASIRTV